MGIAAGRHTFAKRERPGVIALLQLQQQLIVALNRFGSTELKRRARIDEDDVLSAARQLQGLERMEQIRFAVLETSGQITIVPRRDEPPRPVAARPVR